VNTLSEFRITPRNEKISIKHLITNLRLSASAASAPGIVIVILDGEATLYFLTNGLHNLIVTNI